MIKDRYRKILFFFAKAILLIIFWDIFLPRIGLRKAAERSRPERLRRIAVKFRHLAIQLGGVMIKVGQFLSARADIFPAEITDELSGLQDEVPAEEFEAVCKVAEVDLGMALEQRFSDFNPSALAAASLGQAHQAHIDPLEPVVVKIQRPNIEQLIATDMAALRTVGKWLQRYRPIRKRVNIPLLLSEFERILYQEIDYLNEGKNIEIFAKNFSGIPGVRVPKVIWSHTTKRVLTLEDVGRIKINDYEAISEAGIVRSEVAARLLDIYFKQIFEDGFFHADPHPGNLFVNPLDYSSDGTRQWELVLVDFGMVGTISPETKRGLREMLIAFATRDSARLIQSYQILNILLPGADLELLEKADAKAFERFWGKNMSELRDISQDEIMEILAEFRGLVFSLPFQIPHDLIFLARSIGLLSGMCTGLDPMFNVWDHIAPFAQKLIFQESPTNLWSRLPGGFSEIWVEMGKLIQKLISLPGRTEAVLERVERGDLVIRDRELNDQMRRLTIAIQRAGGEVVLAALIISIVQLYLGGSFTLALIVGITAALVFLFLIFARLQE
jgi:predicted unusual protein kinase regulating ubiquinone biosynthesis (AarF/ABC1/UbiB family)